MSMDTKELGALSPQEKRAVLAELLRSKMREPKVLPVSFAQQRLWFLDRLQPGSSLYSIPAAVRLPFAIQREALAQSINEIVRRHDTLRTTFRNVDGVPHQVIAREGQLDLAYVDLGAMPSAARELEVQRLAAIDAHRGFDLSTGPLLRATLVRLDDADHVLLLAMHHIVSDAWSMGILFRELEQLYDAFSSGRRSSLPELPIQYGDFAVWQREWLSGETLAGLLSYWKGRLAAAAGVLDLPTDRPRPPVQSFRGATHSFRVGPEVTRRLRALGQEEGATLFMTLLAAFATLLHRYTGLSDLVIGTPIANRNRAEIESLIGFFVNTLVIRSTVEGAPSFRQLLARVRETTLGAYAHQDLPFERLVEELSPDRSLSRSPLIQVMFTLQTAPGGGTPSVSSGGAASPAAYEVPSSPMLTGTSKFDLSLWMGDSGEMLAGAFEYNTDLFEPATITRMVAHFQTLLEGLAVRPEDSIWTLPLLTGEERRQILVDWNATAGLYPEQSLHDLVAAQAVATPDAPAVALEETVLTYRALNERANQLAHFLRGRGIGAESLVGVVAERSPDSIVAILGVMKAGGAYVPIDPDYPRARIAYLLSDSKPVVVLAPERLLDRLPAEGTSVVCLDRDGATIARESRANPEPVTTLENVAYVMYTSGSTGNPKGVVVLHRGLANLNQATRTALGVSSGDRVLQFVSLSFDISVWDMVLAFGAGATLVLGTRESLQPSELSRFIDEQGVTVTTLLPSVYLALDPRDLAKVRIAVSGGELCTAEVPARLARDRCFINGYGPTENTIAATLTPRWTDTGRRPPIGRPLLNMQAYVLDEHRQPVPVGVPGELYIGGAGLARGYLHRAELTAERFISNPFGGAPSPRLYRTGDLVRWRPDGQIDFLGRIDAQVKVRGYRVELGEIESVMREYPGVRDAGVAVPDGAGEKRLAGFYVGPAAAVDLRAFLKERLPEYMVPSTLHQLESLPLMPNGKLDRNALKAGDHFAAKLDDYVAPRTPTEKAVAQIWEDVLGGSRVGVHDNFFELGGHSLSATQVISRIRHVLQVELPLRALFEAPDVASLARVVEDARAATAVEGAVPATSGTDGGSPGGRTAPLSFAQQRLWFLDRLQPGTGLYNLPAAIRLPMSLQHEALERSINEIIRRHESLRTTFTFGANGEPRQVIAAQAPLRVAVKDLRSLTETDRDAETQRMASLETATGFDLEKGPLVRATLLRLGDADHLLLLTMHHIVSDAWSMRVLSRELTALYEAFGTGRPSPLPELPLQYADFVAWQRRTLQGQKLESLIAYWRQALEGAPALMPLPTDHARPPVQSFRGAALPFSVPASIAQPLRAVAHREGVTLFMTLLAAFVVLLRRHSRQDDIVVGTSIANRNRTEIEPLIGFFVNALVLRSRVSGAASFRQLLAQVRETTLGAYAHQDLPFERLVEELQPQRTLAYNPLFQVMFLFNTVREMSVRDGGQTPEVVARTAKFDLTLALLETDESLVGGFEYNTDLFEPNTMGMLVEELVAILAMVGEGVERDVDAIAARLEQSSRERRSMQERQFRDGRRSKLGTVQRRRVTT